MSTSECVNTIINGSMAIGTIVVAILAIWGDSIRAKFNGPKLSLVPLNLKGLVVPLSDGKLSIYYHLKVENKRSTINATNCRVNLKKILRKGPNGDFLDERLIVPLTFKWGPSEITPLYVNLRKEQVLDFGIAIQGEDHFRPVLHSYTNNFKGLVRKGEVFRFGLEIVSDNFVSPKLQVFEVAWNGQWSEDLEIMAQNLQIQEISD
jgi:hypothetical protein